MARMGWRAIATCNAPESACCPATDRRGLLWLACRRGVRVRASLNVCVTKDHGDAWPLAAPESSSSTARRLPHASGASVVMMLLPDAQPSKAPCSRSSTASLGASSWSATPRLSEPVCRRPVQYCRAEATSEPREGDVCMEDGLGNVC